MFSDEGWWKEAGCRCVHVLIYLKKADTYRHAFSRFFSSFGAHTSMLGDWQFVVQKKIKLIKTPNQFNLEGEIKFMTLVSPFCRMLHVL